MTEQSLHVLNIPLTSGSTGEVLEKIEKNLKNEANLVIFTPNPEFLVLASKDPVFKDLLLQADLNLPDGIGLVWASQFLKTKPVLKERVSGVDLVEQLFILGQRKSWKFGVVGNRRGDVKQAEEQIGKLIIKFPNCQIANFTESQKFDIVLACQGMGKQERWIIDNKNKGNGTIFIGVGGALDLLSGDIKRAPVWVQNIGLEWLWRLMSNPRKHFRRVINAVIVFPWLVIREKLSNK